MKHGIYVSKQSTSSSTPVVSTSGIPFVIGVAPLQSAEEPAPVGVPILCTSWNDAVKKLGYSEDWKKYTLCEFMYSHFKLFGCQPVIFCNLLNADSMSTEVAANDFPVLNHKITLPFEAINNEALIVKSAGGTGNAHIKNEDYLIFYDSENCIIELLKSGNIYDDTTLNVTYNKIDPTVVTDTAVAVGLESIEQCMSVTGLVPDLICAPKFSKSTAVASVMTTKAESINGLFGAKALIDIDSSDGGVNKYSDIFEYKNSKNLTDINSIVCWPMVKLDNHLFHMSTQIAGLIASVDSSNDGCPYESPSNKPFKCDSVVLDNGDDVILTLSQANTLNAGGVVTALSFMGKIVAWGNYMACYPGNTDIKDFFIPLSRMFDWIGNTEICTFWSKLDKPMNRRLIDSTLDTINIWLNGLVGRGYLLGARAEFREEENPLENLSAGIIRIHNYLTPPSPAQEINFILEYDVNYATSALQG